MKARIVEILQYTLKKESGEAFHQVMREISVPLHVRNGIDVVAYGNSLHDADSYYLIRAFESEEQMKSVLDDFYASADWREGPREAIINRIETSLKAVLMLSGRAVEGMRG
ncbi:NIPSNAP family protein [Enterobacter sp. ENT03]|uniref:NIPSNAP family protein n=1 Tax=Enterobacter sp. ENT03 TaxID=2854780 RepID=UPI001C44B99F|nr:NIPSNAP family protein [Enterobacter sp. ENT03]MBV7404340.1 NIPSNAP family protein [Enterobacter sp. ENT03]